MSRHGFTLLELMVGLAISAVTITIVARGYAMVSASITSLEQRRRESTRSINAQRWLTEALGSVEAGSDSGGVFDGQPDRLHCSTWVMGPGGWPERTTLDLRLEHGALRASTRRGDVTLADSIATIIFDYLLEPGLDSRWVNRWESPVSTPFGIRIRTLRRGWNPHGRDPASYHPVDTLFVLIGARG